MDSNETWICWRYDPNLSPDALATPLHPVLSFLSSPVFSCLCLVAPVQLRVNGTLTGTRSCDGSITRLVIRTFAAFISIFTIVQRKFQSDPCVTTSRVLRFAFCGTSFETFHSLFGVRRLQIAYFINQHALVNLWYVQLPHLSWPQISQCVFTRYVHF